MKKHKIFIRILISMHFIIALLALFVATTVTFNGATQLLFFFLPMALFGIGSAICLLIEKPSGRWISIIFGLSITSLGIYLFSNNLWIFTGGGLSFWDNIDIYLGASGGYIDLICIGFGIFYVIYFNRKNVKDFLNGRTQSN